MKSEESLEHDERPDAQSNVGVTLISVRRVVCVCTGIAVCVFALELLFQTALQIKLMPWWRFEQANNISSSYSRLFLAASSSGWCSTTTIYSITSTLEKNSVDGVEEIRPVEVSYLVAALFSSSFSFSTQASVNIKAANTHYFRLSSRTPLELIIGQNRTLLNSITRSCRIPSRWRAISSSSSSWNRRPWPSLPASSASVIVEHRLGRLLRDLQSSFHRERLTLILSGEALLASWTLHKLPESCTSSPTSSSAPAQSASQFTVDFLIPADQRWPARNVLNDFSIKYLGAPFLMPEDPAAVWTLRIPLQRRFNRINESQCCFIALRIKRYHEAMPDWTELSDGSSMPSQFLEPLDLRPLNSVMFTAPRYPQLYLMSVFGEKLQDFRSHSQSQTKSRSNWVLRCTHRNHLVEFSMHGRFATHFYLSSHDNNKNKN